MISFVYFDVGGVVVQDFSGTNEWTNMTRDMGISPENHQRFIEFWSEHESEVCMGRNVEELIPLINKEFNIKLPDDYSFLKDFVSRFKRNETIWPVLNKIKKQNKIGLLTNMFPGLLEAIYEHNLMPSIKWDVVIDSTVVGFQKPDRKIFEIAEQTARTKKDEILFVENVDKNVLAAKDFGWQTFFYDSENMQDSSNKLADFFGS